MSWDFRQTCAGKADFCFLDAQSLGYLRQGCGQDNHDRKAAGIFLIKP